MDTLQIDKSNAVNAYNSADDKTKKFLETLFGAEHFAPKNIMERVRTLEDAISIATPSDNLKMLIEYNGIDPEMISASNYAKLIIIARALNEGWTPDWSNSNEYKYVPYFKHKSGFGLSFNGYAYWYTFAGVGSRLCFKSSELATYAATQFADIYNDYLTIK